MIEILELICKFLSILAQIIYFIYLIYCGGIGLLKIECLINHKPLDSREIKKWLKNSGKIWNIIYGMTFLKTIIETILDISLRGQINLRSYIGLLLGLIPIVYWKWFYKEVDDG